MRFADGHDNLLGGERLLVRTIRLAAREIRCAALTREFEDVCGPGGGQAFRALECFLQQLALHGRRRLAVSAPGERRLTTDEALILDVFALAQAEDYRTLDERLWGLTGSQPPVSLGGAACLVAQAFGMAGLFLRVSLTPAQGWAASTTPVRTAAQCAAAAATT